MIIHRHDNHHAIGVLLSIALMGGMLGLVAGTMDKSVLFGGAEAVQVYGKSAGIPSGASKIGLTRRERRALRIRRAVGNVASTYPMKTGTLSIDAAERLDVDLNIGMLEYEKLGIFAPIGKPSLVNWKNRNWRGLEEQMQYALRYGLALYPNSPHIGQNGKLVIAGHSSPPTIDAIGTPYEDIFAKLPYAKTGDTVSIRDAAGRKFIYKITDSKEIPASQTSILLQNTKKNEIILFTCYPVGTTRSRWAVWGTLVKS